MSDLAQQLKLSEISWDILVQEWEGSRVNWESRERIALEKKMYYRIESEIEEYLRAMRDLTERKDEFMQTLQNFVC